jgi:hypothetical protein
MKLFKEEIQLRRYISQEQDSLIQVQNNVINLQDEVISCLNRQLEQRLDNKLISKQEQIDLQCIEQEIVSSKKRANKIEIRIKILQHIIKIINSQY